MITLIGARCKCCKAFSRGVLIFHSIRKFENLSFFILPHGTKSKTPTWRSGSRPKASALSFLCWWFNAGDPPVLIPNTEVKPSSADGTRKGRVGSRQHKKFNLFLLKLFCFILIAWILKIRVLQAPGLLAEKQFI